MPSGVARDDAYQARLVEFLRDEYGIRCDALSAAPRGYWGETWRVDAGERSYFMKLDYAPRHQVAYERSFAVLDRLNRQRIDFVPQVVTTAEGKLSARYDGAVAGVFDWIDAVNTETDDTKVPEYAMIARVYSSFPLSTGLVAARPRPWGSGERNSSVSAHPASVGTADVSGLDIPREDFSPAAANRVFQQWRRLEEAHNDATARRARTIVERYRADIEPRAQRLFDFAACCAPDRSGFFLTHGDAGGNFMTAPDGRHFIVDWDEVMLAPPERDAWVMCLRDWARAAFTDALRREGIDYELRPERLAYYVYHMFFVYLSEFLDAIDVDGVRPLEEYFEGFIRERLEYADTHFTPGRALS